MSNGIQVALGIETEASEMMMQFWLHDDGAQISNGYTLGDLDCAIAVLRDLADAIELKRKRMTN